MDYDPKQPNPTPTAQNSKQSNDDSKDSKAKTQTKMKAVSKSPNDKVAAKSPRPPKPTSQTKTNQAPKKKPLEKSASRGASRLRVIARLGSLKSPRKVDEDDEQFAEETSQHEDENKKNEEYSLHHQLIPALKSISRQKLRSLRMGLRKIHSSSEDGFVSINDAVTLLNDLNFEFPSRLLDFLIHECEIKGDKIQHEKMISYFQKAHSLSGRDSVEAIDTEEIDSGLQAQTEITDIELFKRAELQLIKSREPFDMDHFRNELKRLDHNHSGIIKKNEIEKLAVDNGCPIYGSLLHTVLSRSDEAKNNDIRWPEFINFLEKVYKTVLEKDPEFLEKLKKKEIAKPLPSREVIRNKFKNIAVRARAQEKEIHGSPVSTAITVGERNDRKENDILNHTNKDSAKSTTVKKNQTNKSSNNRNPKTNSKNQKSKPTTTTTSTKKKENLRPASKLAMESQTPVEQEKEKQMVQVQIESCPKVELWPSDASHEKSKSSNTSELPIYKLKIEWVHGFRGRDVLCNLALLPSGELIYFTGRVVILFAFCQNSQRHYCEHSTDIESLAAHSEGIIIASSQMGNSPSIHQWDVRIWRSDNLTTLYVLKEDSNPTSGRPVHMEFSTLKNWLLVVDDSKEHFLSLWDIKGQRLANTSASRNAVMSISCSRADENVFVTTGYEHIVWWEYKPHMGEIQLKCIANHRGFLKAKITYTCMFTNHNELITGDSNGTVYVWAYGGNAVTNYIKHAHENYVLSLCVYKSFLFTGDSQGQIMLWLFNKNLDNLGMIMIPQGEGGVRHMLIAYSSSNQPILIIGTTTNSLLQLLLAHGKKVLHPFENVEFGVDGLTIAITQGHYGRVDKVSQVMSNDNWFITAGRDGQICVFDADKRLGVQKTRIKGHQFTAVCWLLNDSIALGTVEGRCIVLDQQEMSLVESYNEIVLPCSVSAMFTFQDSDVIYLGGLDGGLIVLMRNIEPESVDSEKESWIKTFIQTPIYGIDFIQGGCLDNKTYLWLSNKSGGISAYDIESMNLIVNLADIKNVEWTTQHCGLIPDVAGAWMTPLIVEEKASSISVHRNKEILSIGTSQGKIATYRFPCLSPEAYCHSNVTGSPITSLLFLKSDEHLISISGNESCIIQWRIE